MYCTPVQMCRASKIDLYSLILLQQLIVAVAMLLDLGGTVGGTLA
jgi:hypothetical protein